MDDSKGGFRKYSGLTFLIGFGFFTMGIMDVLYDTYLPIFLSNILEKMFEGKGAGNFINTIVGFIMTFDNILAIFLIPIIAVWSDNTRTKIGRRMPFIVILLPLSAICFSAIPYMVPQALMKPETARLITDPSAATNALVGILLVVFGLNIFKQSVRGPVVALMPDTIPGEFRSEANGIINTMGALGAIISTLGLAKLMNLNIALPLLGNTQFRLPFPIAGFLVVLATVLLYSFVREKSSGETAREEKVPVFKSIKGIAGQADKSALWILLALFFWFLGYQGILPFIGKFCNRVLDIPAGNAALPAGFVAIAQALFAIPSGFIAHRIGRRKAIRIALIALIVILGFGAFIASPLANPLGSATRFYMLLGMMFVYGIFWITIITNSFPMLWQMATFGTIGIYTGLYYTFSQAAAISSPPLTGFLIDRIGYSGIFIFAALCMGVAFYFMGKVKKGEASEKTQPKAA